MMQGYMLAAAASAQVRYCSPGIPKRWELHMGLLISNTLAHNLNVACLYSRVNSFPVRTGKDSRTVLAISFLPLLSFGLFFLFYFICRRQKNKHCLLTLIFILVFLLIKPKLHRSAVAFKV